MYSEHLLSWFTLYGVRRRHVGGFLWRRSLRRCFVCRPITSRRSLSVSHRHYTTTHQPRPALSVMAQLARRRKIHRHFFWFTDFHPGRLMKNLYNKCRRLIRRLDRGRIGSRFGWHRRTKTVQLSRSRTEAVLDVATVWFTVHGPPHSRARPDSALRNGSRAHGHLVSDLGPVTGGNPSQPR